MQPREVIKKQAIEKSLQELKQFNQVPAIQIITTALQKIHDEEKGFALDWSAENSENNLKIIDALRNGLLMILDTESYAPLGYTTELYDSVYAVLVVLTKYWPRNNYSENKEGRFVPQCPIYLSLLTHDESQVSDNYADEFNLCFAFSSCNGRQYHIEDLSKLSLIDGKLCDPTNRQPFNQRDIDYMGLLFKQRNLKFPSLGKAKEGAEVGGIIGAIPSYVSFYLFVGLLAAAPGSPEAISFSLITLAGSQALAWLSLIFLPIIAGVVLGYTVGALIDTFYSFTTNRQNSKINLLLDSIEAAPASPGLPTQWIQKNLPQSPSRQVVPEIKNDSKDVPQTPPRPSSSSVPTKEQQLAWLDKVKSRSDAERQPLRTTTDAKRASGMLPHN